LAIYSYFKNHTIDLVKKIFWVLPFFILTFFLFWSLSKPNISKDESSFLGCIPVSDQNQLSDQYDPAETVGEYLGLRINIPPLIDSFAYVLGDSVGSKRIEVNLSNQHVYGFDGNSKIFDFVVSTGKWARTPTGNFTIERKVRAQKMSGGRKELGTYYYLPNVPWVMFFGNKQIPWSRGFSFHGTYWHNNFGQPMSHGCVNMKTPEAEQLFNWAPIGTPVIIY